MQVRRHPKHKDVSADARADWRVLSGDTGVTVLLQECDPWGIPHPGVVLKMSVADARHLAARLIEEAEKAATMGAAVIE